MTVVVRGHGLTIRDLVLVAREGARVSLDPEAVARMQAAHDLVERSLAGGAAVYGGSTAVGVLKRVALAENATDYSSEVLRTHRVAQGPTAPPDLVRGTMLRLLNAYAQGVTAVRPLLAERLVAALNDGEVPPVRTLGSVGQADLAPMADLCWALFSDTPLVAGEGLALVSSNAFSTAAAALAVHDAGRLLGAATAAGALSLEGLGANPSLFHPGIGEVRPYPGLRRALAALGRLLEGSAILEPDAARSLQDPLTFRNLPQLLGAWEDAQAYVTSLVAIELNASDSNPVVLPGEPAPVSVANYESLPLAAALDHLRVVLASLLGASSERTVKLLETTWSGLPTGLADAPGSRDPGLAYLGIVAQSLAAEARLLGAPVSFELASTSHAEGIEDRTTMTALGARRLAEQVGLGWRLVALEMTVAARAVELRGTTPLGRGTREVRALVREHVEAPVRGHPVPDVEPLATRLAQGRLPRAMERQT